MSIGQISGLNGFHGKADGTEDRGGQTTRHIRFQNTLAAARAAAVERTVVEEAGSLSEGVADTPSRGYGIPIAGQTPPAGKIASSVNRMVRAYQTRPDSGLDIRR